MTTQPVQTQPVQVVQVQPVQTQPVQVVQVQQVPVQQVQQQVQQPTTAATTGAAGEFGNSDYGTRLNYNSEFKCNDIFFAILFILHLLAIFVVCIVYHVVLIGGYVTDLEGLGYTVNKITFTIELPSSFYGGLAVCVVVCSLWGVIWLKICQHYPSNVIKFSLFMMVFYGVALIILGAATLNSGGQAYIAFGAIFTLVSILYTYCVWSLIPFSSVLLSISSNIITTFKGTIYIGISTIFMNVAWYIIWIIALFGIFIEPSYRYYTVRACRLFKIVNYQGSEAKKSICMKYDGDTTDSSYPGFGSIFLLILSLYWGYNVVKNIAHTTTCGVTGAWYFSGGVLESATVKALKHSLTTSFGSIALGSLIVALLQTLRAFFKQARGFCVCLACFFMCFLYCIEYLIKKFNKYAFCYCAIYGHSFMQAAGSVWQLLFSKGFMLIVNDSIIGVVVRAGGFLGFLLSLGISLIFMLPEIDKSTSIGTTAFYILLIVFICVIGYAFTSQILQVLDSSVACLFVCFAEDPNALKSNRPNEFNNLANSGNQKVTQYMQFGHAEGNAPTTGNNNQMR